MTKMQEVSLWLVPQPKDIDYLQAIIDRLAHQYQAPPFHPHVTVAGRLQVPDQYQTPLAALASATPILPLQNQGLGHSSELFRTVYIRTSLADPLVALRQQVFERWPENIAKPYMPHISLIYKPLSKPERQIMIQSLAVKDRFIFDTLVAVSPKQQGEWTAVESWEIVGRWPLGKAAI